MCIGHLLKTTFSRVVWQPWCGFYICIQLRRHFAVLIHCDKCISLRIWSGRKMRSHRPGARHGLKIYTPKWTRFLLGQTGSLRLVFRSAPISRSLYETHYAATVFPYSRPTCSSFVDNIWIENIYFMHRIMKTDFSFPTDDISAVVVTNPLNKCWWIPSCKLHTYYMY